MFFDEIKIKKNVWHYKLLKLSIGESNIPKHNYCPYFWLTVFFTLISPIWLVLVLLYKGFEKILDGIDYIAEKYWDWIYSTILKIDHSDWPEHYGVELRRGYLYSSEVDDYFRFHPPPNKKGEFYLKLFETWKEKTPNWKEELDKIKQRRIEEEERQEKLDRLKFERKQKFKERKRKFFSGIIKATKKAFPFIVGILCLGVLYFIGLGGKYLYDHWDWEVFGGVVLILGFIGIIVLFIIFIFQQLQRLEFSEETTDKIEKAILKIGVPFSWIHKNIFKPVKGFFKHFYYGIKSWKSDNCPAIIWEEEEEE